MRIKQAVLLCGGKGTRLKPITNTIPKTMVNIHGKPFLYYLLKQLSKKNISEFVLLTGYLGEQIQDYFKSGKKYGWKIKYSKGPSFWNTGKRILEAKKLFQNNFMLLYSDNYLNFNIDILINYHFQNNKNITLQLVKKKQGNISLDSKKQIQYYDSFRKKENLDYVEIGYMLIRKKNLLKDFKNLSSDSDFNFSSVLKQYSIKKKLGNVLSDNIYYSISDIKRLKLTKNFLNKKKILLIDRDGIINEKASKARYIEKWKEFKFIDKNIKALKILSNYGFKFIVITNQAGIARGMMTHSQLYYIHKKMKDYLIEMNIEILKIYFSPDHFSSFSKTRKPAPGMLFQASKDFRLNLDNCIYVGDDIRDCKTAYNAGSNSIFIGHSSELKKLNINEYPLKNYSNMLESIQFINKFYQKNNDYIQGSI